jgi:ATP-dependent DNA helicase RecG
MHDVFETPVVYLKGVGPRKAEILKKELNIVSFNDLLQCFPFCYIDKSKLYKVAEVTTDTTWFQLKGSISQLRPVGEKRMKYITASFTDDTGTIGLVWFRGLRWVKSAFSVNKEYLLFGKPSVFKNRFNFVHPEIEEFDATQESVAGQLL